MSFDDGFYIRSRLISYNGTNPRLREDLMVHFCYRGELRSCKIEILSQIEVLSNSLSLDAVILLPWGKVDGLSKVIQVGDEFTLNALHDVLAKGEVLEVFDA